MTDHRRVLRFEIPVNDQAHDLPLGAVLMLHPWRLSQKAPAGRVEVWVEVWVPNTFPHHEPGPQRQVQIFGTGQPVPDSATWLASCLDGSLVWHLYDVSDCENCK